MKKAFTLGVCAFALGVAGTLAVTSADGVAQENTGPKEAKPQLMAPNPGFIQQLSFADLVEEVSPAVVSIRTEADVPVRGNMGIPPEFRRMLPPGFQFHGEPQEGDEEGDTTRRALGQGSGFFIDDQGHIVTNNHVIQGADAITVVMNNGEEIDAELVGTDPSTDIAVLKVEPSSEQRYVKFETQADLRVGDYVLAVGNPFGLGGSVTSGIVSAIGRDGGASNPYADFIQIDASINKGNSGGPTFDLRGNVVGVNTAIVSPTGGNVGIGLAVPADVASQIVDQLIEDGAVTRGWLGVSIRTLDDRLASAVGLDEPTGALVQAVQPGSPAEKAKFADGDVILEFNGVGIASANELTRVVGSVTPGKTVKAEVLRDGKKQTLDVTLAKRDPMGAREAGASSAEPSKADETELELGITLSSIPSGLREEMGLADDEEGVLITAVDRSSEAADAGFQPKMVLTRADNKSVKSADDLKKIVKAARERKMEAILVRVRMGRQAPFFLALPVDDENRG